MKRDRTLLTRAKVHRRYDAGTTALARLEQTMVAAVATGRVVMMAEVAGSAWSLRRVVRHPRVLGAGVAGLAAQNVWAATRAIARRTVDDPWIGWSDAAAVSAALVTEVTSWGVRGLPPGSNWSLLFSTVVCAWLPLELPSTPMLNGGARTMAGRVSGDDRWRWGRAASRRSAGQRGSHPDHFCGPWCSFRPSTTVASPAA